MPRSMRSLQVTLPSSILTIVCCIAPLARGLAQQTPAGLVEVKESSRRGFWLGLGAGAGGESNNFVGGAGYSEAFYQPTVSLRAGGTVGSHLRLGG
jgi:hypothetical protein